MAPRRKRSPSDAVGGRRAEDPAADGPRCPVCRAPLGRRRRHRHFPFCGERCKLIDLGRWLDGRYHIEVPAEAADTDVSDEHDVSEAPPVFRGHDR